MKPWRTYADSPVSYTHLDVYKRQIPNYATRNLTLTANNYIWQFVGGRLSYLAPNPTYTSGEIVGGNYKIKFDSQGYATSIKMCIRDRDSPIR